ncbi:amidohydrolase family protein [Rhodococcus sp. G-MC3]|uniref:amidohydrolase family protein n=1 Tax=Rhodococcus sp. G-MC3 TaxID=3046209 RepID=UPI0024B8FB37|nr:amidohydrolase family protein [Rhodococcus sp. G-MC3]MDJ0396256.1 amidohydrolase family protein [Rhodococcus sp. G-MC3]
MSSETTVGRRVISVEAHAWTSELRDALLRYGGDDTVNVLSSREQTDHRLREVGEERLARMDAAGVDLEVLSITTPGTQPLHASEAIPLAHDANDFLADAVRAHPDRFAAFATLPTPDPEAAARELERCVQQLGMVGAQVVPLTGDRYLDHPSFRPVFEAAAALKVPLYLHPGQPLKAARDAMYGGFDDWTTLNLGTGGWGWHVDAGLAALRLVLAGTFDRHPDLQIVLGRWGELLIPFADRADLLSEGNLTLERRVIDYITGNIHVTAGGVLSHRMLTAAIDVLGPGRVMYGDDDPYRGMKGRFGGKGGAAEFVDTAPIGSEERHMLGHLNAERLLRL